MNNRTVNDVLAAVECAIQNTLDTRIYYITSWSEAVGLTLTGNEQLQQRYYKIHHHYDAGSFTVTALQQQGAHLHEDYAHQLNELPAVHSYDFSSISFTCIYDAKVNQVTSYRRPVLKQNELCYEICQEGVVFTKTLADCQQAVAEVAMLEWETERLKRVYQAMIESLGRALTVSEIHYIESQKAQWLTKKVALPTIVAALRQGLMCEDSNHTIELALEQWQKLQANPLAHRRYIARQSALMAQHKKEFSE